MKLHLTLKLVVRLACFAPGCAIVFGTALQAMPKVHTLKGGDAWVRNFRDPSSVAVQFQGQINALGTAGISLGGQTAMVTNDVDDICGDLWLYTSAPTVYLVPRQTYALTMSGSAVYGFNLVGIYVPDPPTVPSTTKGNQSASLHYRAYIWNTNSTLNYYNPTNNWTQSQIVPGWEPLCSANMPQWNSEADGDGSCDSVSETFLIQIRPDGNARPLATSATDDEENETGDRDETAIDANTAPGDGGKVTISAGQSTDPSSINISWAVQLGRLWNGASAGEILLLAQRLSDGSAYAAACLNYGARSSDTNEIDVVYQSTNSTVIQQIKAPQSFVNVNANGATASVSVNSHGVLTNLVLTSVGGRYSSAPTVTIHDPAGTGSNGLITAQISSGGIVTTLVLANAGTNYSSGTAISIAPPCNSIALDFYLPSAITGVTTNGFFTISPNAVPFVTWWVDSPNGSTTSWRLREMRNTTTNDTTLQYSTSSGYVWTLTQGTGSEARMETRTVVTNISGGVTNRQETQQVQSGGGAVSDVTVESYQQFPWGWQLVAVTNDPAGAKLVTTFAYGTNTNTGDYGQLTFTAYPDGYWEQRVYGDTNTYPYPNYDVTQGLLFRVITPWMNGPPGPIDPTGSEIEQCLVAQYGPAISGAYGNGDYGLVKWYNAAQYGENEGWSSSLITARCYAEETIFTEQDCFSAGQFIAEEHDIGQCDNTTKWMPGKITCRWDGSYGRLAGQNYYVEDTDPYAGEMDCYDYQFGQWIPSTYTFNTNGPGTNDVRKIIYHTAISWAGGWFPAIDNSVGVQGDPLYYGDSGAQMAGGYLSPFQSTKDVKILQNGNLVARESYAYIGNGNYALTSQIVYQRDCLGHATNIFRVDPLTSQILTIYKADWQGGNAWPADLKLSETDKSGTTITYAYDSLKRIKTKTKQGVSASGFPSQNSIVTTLNYDSASRILTNSVASGSLALNTVSTFDVSGRLTALTTPDGLTTTYTFGGGGQQTNITYSSGTTEVISNYLDRRLASITGSAVTNQYFSYALTPYDPNAGCPFDENYGYEPRNNTTNMLGNPTSQRWTVSCTDAAGIQCEQQQPAFNSPACLYAYTYDRAGKDAYGTFETGITNSDGSQDLKTTIYCYDFLGNVTCQLINISSNVWDDMADSGWASMNRGYSNYWFYQSDSSGAWFKVTQQYAFLGDWSGTSTLMQTVEQRLTGFSSSQQSETRVYDAFGNLTDTNVTINYGNAMVTTVVTVPQSTLTATSVAVNGLLQTESTPTVSNPTWHFYDALGRETGKTDPLGFSTTTSYNATTGQMTARSDPAGNVTSYAYYAAGGTNAGLLRSQTDPNGKNTYFNYDGCGRLIQKWGDVPYPEQLTYNQFGDLVTLQTFRGGSGWTGFTWPSTPGTADTTTWSYDQPTGLLTNKQDASGNSVSYFYYNNRLLQSCTWARGVSYTNYYNGLNDLIATVYSDGTTGIVYTNQDRRGLPRLIVDANGNCVMAYDVLSRVTTETWTSGLDNGITISNNYDPVYGRNALVTTGLSSTLNTVYSYDTYGRMNSVSSGTSHVGYGYLPNSDLLQTTSCSNASSAVLTTSRQWDYGFRLRSIANTVNGSAVTSHAYTYDNVNRRTQATLEDGSIWKYAYNNRNELTGAARFWSDWSPVTGQQYGYGFDNIGNRTSAQVGSVGNMPASTYAVNGLNEYTNTVTPGYKDILGDAIATNTVTINSGLADRKVEYFHKQITVANSGGPVWQKVTNSAGGATNTGGLVFPASSQSLTYDADGNLTFDGVWTYIWDADNRLIEMNMANISGIAASNRLQLVFDYDYMNRRISKVVSTNSTGSNFVPQSTNYFIYDGWNLIATFGPTDTIQQSFVWGLDLSRTMTKAGGIGGLAEITAGGTNYVASYDGNGNITGLINGVDKTTSARYEYSPFGELTRATGPMAKANSFRFSTKFYDDESGLLYYGYRYYSPTFGRWIGRDPAYESGGVNLYLAVANNAVGQLDSNGRVTLFGLLGFTQAEAAELESGAFYANIYARLTWTFQSFGELTSTIFSDLPSVLPNAFIDVGKQAAGMFASRAGRAAYVATYVYVANHSEQISAGFDMAFGRLMDYKSPQVFENKYQEVAAIADAVIDWFSDPDSK
jgi:RHS repeat-associated protein